MDTAARCIARKQWQNAAAVLGCSQHSVRLKHDPAYQRIHEKARPMVVTVPSLESLGIELGAGKVSIREKAEFKAAARRAGVSINTLCADVNLCANYIHTGLATEGNIHRVRFNALCEALARRVARS